MNFSPKETICLVLVVAALSAAIFFLWRNFSLRKKISDLSENTSSISSEKQSLESEKEKADEKNKKLWLMSEAVYKEKKKVEEENETLLVEKEKLEVEKKKVDEKVKKLWSQSMAIHKEKERINELKTEVELKHKEVMDSVTYAQRIQEAILPDLKEIAAQLPEYFILFKPKDIVAGDFYWFGVSSEQGAGSSEKESKDNNPELLTPDSRLAIIAAVDCTGHGVPGAFMSMIGNTLLNQIVFEKKITEPAGILTALNEEVNRSLKQTQADSESRDGMDVAICSFDLKNLKLNYAGAMRPLYLVRKGELTETKASKFPIGGHDYDGQKNFTGNVLDLKKGDLIYIFTDGFADQFSPDDKKLMTKKFKEVLLTIQNKTMEDQKKYLNDFIENWKGGMEQTDDILVIGIRV